MNKEQNQWAYVGAVILTLYLFTQLGFAGMALAGALIAVYIWLLSRWAKVQELKAWGQRFENVYVVGRHPRTDEDPDLGEIAEVVIFCNHTEVIAKVNEAKRMLEISGNRFWQNGHITVMPFIFQEAQHVNESWEDYEERVYAAIAEDRAKRHAEMKRRSEDAYLRIIKGQEF